VTPSLKSLRKSQSQASILSPIIRLVRYPVTTIESALDTLWVPGVQNAQDKRELVQENRRQLLLQRLRNASDLSAWRDTAEELDVLEGNDAWKADPVSPLYDYHLLQSRLIELDEARASKHPARLLWLLRNTLTRSLSNMGDIQLYKHSHIGTKNLIDNYINAVCDSFDTLLHCYDLFNPNLNSRNVYEELLRIRQSFGRSALLLSGGGTFGMTHSGVVKCLLENNLLPRIISGSSAGSIVASVLCAKTDEELPATLVEFCRGDLEVFERGDEKNLMHKVVRILTTRSVFDVQNLIRVMRAWLGDITFLEAYNRTLRILNISVSSTSMNELPRLMNYITAPNVIVWSAV
jgi:TAG lipase / steryl ester hydrolase / phospholipase A2 / LPA acyltransferase